ncbi:hypothetical protein HH303_16790 [Rhodospirillaceae bacterium KN72]|uniref:Uncharacterized protein n=1 Tax=Pacificispira spongiicola TaxID=2729598 RepID=A0A7Y0E2Q8_9PROT|nr:hypothetical protein [Pacificispira spongiicola]NMM46152.1 hypothetical protein [Pacificispira spongiicola]
MGESKRRKQAGFETGGKSTQKRKWGSFRLTWRVIVLFMLAMILLDILFYAIFRFGFDSCYGVLCLLNS